MMKAPVNIRGGSNRLIHLGALRLLCHAQVMGAVVLQPKSAIQALEVLEADEQTILLHGPAGLDQTRETSSAVDAGYS